MSSKRQQTMAKMTRERKVKERRALKQEKKLARAAEAAAPPVAEELVDQDGAPEHSTEEIGSPTGI